MKPSMHSDEKDGTRRFQWNRGGCFGSQVGASLWLVLLGCLIMAQGRMVGAAVLLFGLVPNLVGVALWRNRHRLSPYPALQLLVATAGISALVSLLILWGSDGPVHSLKLPSSLWFLLVYPGVMLAFHLQERAARKAAA
jgi:hypothetical protein